MLRKKQIPPKFTWIQPHAVRQLNLTPTQIHNNRLEQLRKKLEEEIEKNYELKNDLNYICSILNTLIHHLTLESLITKIKFKIFSSEKVSDMGREKKLKLLIQNSNEVPKSAEINIINFTKNNKKIPENI